jgi:hypothetical protein
VGESLVRIAKDGLIRLHADIPKGYPGNGTGMNKRNKTEISNKSDQ